MEHGSIRGTEFENIVVKTTLTQKDRVVDVTITLVSPTAEIKQAQSVIEEFLSHLHFD